MEKKLEDLIEHNLPEDYEEYIKGFEDFTDDPIYASPRMRWVESFKWVDQRSKENYTSGHADKWFVRGNVSLFRDLIKELSTNQNSSFETCYEKEEIINGEIPEYFSMLLKKPDSKFELDVDVFASHILNYFEVPVAFNRRFDRALPGYPTENYLMSVDVIRSNEKLVLLNEVIPSLAGVEIARFQFDGLKNTLDLVGGYLKKYLDEQGIKYTDNEIEDYKKYLANSILIRRVWLGDYDFRNGNAGILINIKNKTFRALPNFDMEKSFSSPRPVINYEVLEQFYDYDSEMYDGFTERMFEFLSENKKGERPCMRMVDKLIKDDAIKNSMVLAIYNVAGEIWQISNQIRKDRNEAEKNAAEKEILT